MSVDADASASRHLELARVHLGAGRPQRAAAELDAAVALAPENPLVWMLLSDARLGMRDLPGAVEAAGRGVALAPHSPDTHVTLAVALAADGRDLAAERSARAAVELAPQDSRCHAVLAVATLARGRRGPAWAAARRAVELDPTSAWLHTVLARVALSQNRRRTGRQALRTALSLDPTDAEARELAHVVDAASSFTGLGMARGLRGQVDEVRAAPGSNETFGTLERMLRLLFVRLTAPLACGAVLVVRFWYMDAQSSTSQRVTAALTLVVAVGYALAALRGTDADLRAHVQDLLRRPPLREAAVASAVAVALLLTVVVHPTHVTRVGAAVCAFGAWIAAQVASRRTERATGVDPGPRISEGGLVVVAVATWVVGAFFLLATLTAPTTGGAAGWGGLAAALLATGWQALRVRRRRRRRRAGLL